MVKKYRYKTGLRSSPENKNLFSYIFCKSAESNKNGLP